MTEEPLIFADEMALDTEAAHKAFERPGRGPAATLAYLDNAATTRPLPSVCETVSWAMAQLYGNPSSRHGAGGRAREILERSREVVAQAIGAHPDEVVFTSGGTEGNNLAVMGACGAYARRFGQGTLVTSALEHPSVTKSVRAMKRDGWSVEYLDARGGELDLGHLSQVLRDRFDVALVSVMSVQSELGYIFPVDRVVRLVDEAYGPAVGTSGGTARLDGGTPAAFGVAGDIAGSVAGTGASDICGRPRPLVHTDAVQAFGKYDVDVRKTGVDLMTICGHKIGGPKGIGALYVRRGTPLFTTAAGGGQEFGLRSGTQAVPLIAGFAQAAAQAAAERQERELRARTLRQELLEGLSGLFPELIVNSRADGSAFIVNFSLPGTNNSQVIRELDARGVCVSATMACASSHLTVPPGTWREKHPLALQLAGVPKSRTGCTYRVSFGPQSTREDVVRLLAGFAEVTACGRGE
ncbi:MAG: cysteine desulfurase family protein [Eggerthellales bacterium]|nr:cysteine desulfurase family protein [Eggerthellales bacterium]